MMLYLFHKREPEETEGDVLSSRRHRRQLHDPIQLKLQPRFKTYSVPGCVADAVFHSKMYAASCSHPKKIAAPCSEPNKIIIIIIIVIFVILIISLIYAKLKTPGRP